MEWIHFPRIRTFVEKRFHGLFSKKKRSKSGGVPSFPRREHVPAVISLPSGQPTALDPYHEITWLLKIERIFCPRKLFSGSNSSPEKSLQKNRSIFCLKNRSCDRRYGFLLSKLHICKILMYKCPVQNLLVSGGHRSVDVSDPRSTTIPPDNMVRHRSCVQRT